MYAPKFQYKELTRIPTDHGRFYDVGGPRPLPSVTTILSNVLDNTWLDEWRDRVGMVEAERITNEASMIGQGMHDLLERHYTGCDVGKVPPISKIYAEVVKKRGLSRVTEVWGVEAPLYYPDLYAGTSDLIAVHDGIPSILDYKNSRRDKDAEDIEHYFAQLCAYAAASNSLYGTDIRRGVIMMMSRTGKYLEFIIDGSEFDRYMDIWFGYLEAYYEKHGIVKVL